MPSVRLFQTQNLLTSSDSLHLLVLFLLWPLASLCSFCWYTECSLELVMFHYVLALNICSQLNFDFLIGLWMPGNSPCVNWNISIWLMYPNFLHFILSSKGFCCCLYCFKNINYNLYLGRYCWKFWSFRKQVLKMYFLISVETVFDSSESCH